MTATTTNHVARIVEMNEAHGYPFTQYERIPKRSACFAENRGEAFIRFAAALEWEAATIAVSSTTTTRLLLFVHDFVR